MKTTPEEAKRRARATKLESVKVTVRQHTHRSNGFKDLVLTVRFKVECEGRRASGKTEESRYNFIIDSQGNKVAINGSDKNWVTWKAPAKPVLAAVLAAVYGTGNVKNDPASGTSREITWKSAQIQRALTERVRRVVTTKAVSEKISTSYRAARRKAMVGEMSEVLRKFPEMRKQDFLLAFESAKNLQVIREVMET